MTEELNPDVEKRLEEAVLQVFSTSDFHRASIRDIADKAGVSFTTIYKHYGSKERLLFAFVNIWMRRLTDRIEDHLQGIEDLKERLRKVFWLHLDFYERNEGYGRIMFMVLPMQTWMADESFDQKRRTKILLDILEEGRQKGIINQHLRGGFLLDFIFGFIQRTFFMWIMRGKIDGLTQNANALFEMIWQGLANPAILEYKEPIPLHQHEQ